MVQSTSAKLFTLDIEKERDARIKEIQQYSGIDEELLSKFVTDPMQRLFPIRDFISKSKKKMKQIEKAINESELGLQ